MAGWPAPSPGRGTRGASPQPAAARDRRAQRGADRDDRDLGPARTFWEKDTIRIHPIIAKGGAAVSVVPAEVTMEIFMRGDLGFRHRQFDQIRLPSPAVRTPRSPPAPTTGPPAALRAPLEPALGRGETAARGMRKAGANRRRSVRPPPSMSPTPTTARSSSMMARPVRPSAGTPSARGGMRC